METPAASEKPETRRSLLYAVAILLLLMLVLSVTGHLLNLRPAALVGFPVTIIAVTALILVMLVLAEEPRLETRRMGEELLKGCFLPAVAVDPHDGQILAANDGAESILGIASSSRGRHFPDLLRDDACEDSRRIIQNAIDRGEVEVAGCELVTDNEERMAYDLLARAAGVAGSEIVIVAFSQNDGSDSAAEFARVQERLMSNISHEVRTPLNVVLGYSELLAAGTLGELPEKQQEAAEECHESGQRMLALVTDILDVGRSRAYYAEDEIETIDPAELIDRVATLLVGQARREEIKLHIETDDVPSVEAPEALFKQLLYHLMLNSIDRSEEGDTVSVVGTGGDYLTIEVSDIGPMVEDQPRPVNLPVLSENEAMRMSTPPVVGLPLCATLAERLGGRLYVSSDAEGVHFVFERAMTGDVPRA